MICQKFVVYKKLWYNPFTHSSRLDINIEQVEIDETRDFDTSKDSNFPATRFIYDRRANAHHIVTVHNAPQHSSPVFLTGCSTQKKPLSQQFTQPQNLTAQISPDNTLPMVEHTPQGQNSASGDNFGGAIAGIASQQRTQTSSALFKLTTTKKLIFDGRNEIFESFEDLLQTRLKIPPEMNKHFHSHLLKDALQTFRNINARSKRTAEDALIIFRW